MGTLKEGRLILHYDKIKVSKPIGFDVTKVRGNSKVIKQLRMEFAANQEEARRQRKSEYYEKRRKQRIAESARRRKEEERKSAQGNSLPTFKFRSSYNDLEDEEQILQTNYETTYHTFDYENRQITIETERSNGEWMTVSLPMKSWYKDGGHVCHRG